ncbi:MAG: hypothetical protein BMS9Abin29_1408 [Gemmatimonadota bacterium]|nr:MAG: hypothetical protein BMS9Abin29_1408 [Gemmatimonadota bacterium]
MGRPLQVAAMVVWILAVLPRPVCAQRSPAESLAERRLLRVATSLESRGDLAGAERLLTGLLEDHPRSSSGLFALERVLRAQGRVAAVLTAADRFIAVDSVASTPRLLKLRVLLELDSLTAMREAAADWIEADPSSAGPYQEVARVFRLSLGAESALEMLRRGRDILEDEALFAMDVSDLLVQLGRVGQAVAEWSRAIGNDGAQASGVMRRIRAIEGDPADLVGPLVERLGRSPTTVARRRVATRMAIEAGLTEQALAMAEEVLPTISGQPRRGFLADLARTAEREGAHGAALWAYQMQRKYAADPSEARSLDHRITSSALAGGDTAVAVSAQNRVAESLAPRTAERRRALATVLRLGISADRHGTERRLDAFRREFPEAPELDELSVTLALRYQAAGEVVEAERLLSDVDGPRSAVERGYLLLAEGDSRGAGEAFLGAAPELEPAAATEVIQLIGLLGRLSPAGVELLSESAARAHRGDVPGALRVLEERLGALPKQDRVALLVAGARMAQADGDEEAAAALREQVVERFADAPEAAEAILALARFRSREAVGVPSAIMLLENLILARPNSAIVPTARRELERLQGRIPGRVP